MLFFVTLGGAPKSRERVSWSLTSAQEPPCGGHQMRIPKFTEDCVTASNHWVQATPDCAFLFFLSQRPGAPDPGFELMTHRRSIGHATTICLLWGWLAVSGAFGDE